MPVPTTVADLSTTIASNSPAGSDNVFPDLDNYLRALSGILASVANNSATNGYTSPYLALTGGTVSGATTFSSTVTGAKFIPSGTSATGNGMYLPATNTLGWSTNGAEVMRLDASGNLGLGVTPSGWGNTAAQVKSVSLHHATNFDGRVYQNAYNNGTLNIYLNTGAASLYRMSAGQHEWHSAPSGTAGNAITFTQAMTLDASGNLAVGVTTSASATLSQTTTKTAFSITPSNSNAGGTTITNSWVAGGQGPLIFADATSERARITSGGDLLVGRNADVAAERLCVEKDLNAAFLARFRNTNSASPFGAFISYTAAAPNGTSNQFLRCDDNAATRAEIRSNGGIANYSANDVNLSDRREKTNFAPARSYLDTICAIPVQTFNYIDQSEDDPGLTLGVVAQDVQAVAPELVMESNWGTEDNPKMRLSVYQTDLQYALMKCIQEQQELIKDLRARVAALEAA